MHKQLAMSAIQMLEATIANFDTEAAANANFEIATEAAANNNNFNNIIKDVRYKRAAMDIKQNLEAAIAKFEIAGYDSDEDDSDEDDSDEDDSDDDIQVYYVFKIATHSLRKSAATYAPTCYFPKKEAATAS